MSFPDPSAGGRPLPMVSVFRNKVVPLPAVSTFICFCAFSSRGPRATRVCSDSHRTPVPRWGCLKAQTIGRLSVTVVHRQLYRCPSCHMAGGSVQPGAWPQESPALHLSPPSQDGSALPQPGVGMPPGKPQLNPPSLGPLQLPLGGPCKGLGVSHLKRAGLSPF